jgi:hypothetical protein
MSSPAITIHTGKKWSISNCNIFYITDIKKYFQKPLPFLHATWTPDFSGLHEQYRYDWLSNWAINNMAIKNTLVHVFVEGYSFASTGLISNIAENTELLKYKLWNKKFNYTTVAPTTIKKYATGKGNSKKLQMYESFVKDTGVDLISHFEKSNPERSPISDIVDSYFICKYGFHTLS